MLPAETKSNAKLQTLIVSATNSCSHEHNTKECFDVYVWSCKLTFLLAGCNLQCTCPKCDQSLWGKQGRCGALYLCS